MRFRIEQRFTSTVELVEDALCDPAFVECMASLPKLGQPRLLAHTVDGRKVRLQVRYAFAGELSGAVRRVVDPAKLTWVEQSTIDRSTHRTSFRIVPDHYPGLLRCEGTFTLTPVDEGSSMRVADGTITVNMPLVGSKVERAIVSGLEEHAAGEIELVQRWVAEHRA